MSPKGSILVGGGSGFIGSYLCKLLKAKGYDVFIISRMPGVYRMTWTDIQDKGIPKGIKAVINLAGQNVLDPARRWTEGFKQNVWNSRVNTTATLANAIKKSESKPSIYVSMSGVGIYKPSKETVYTESTQTTEFDFLSKLCHNWEKSSLLPPDSKCRVVNLRSGVVLGKNGGMIKQLYLPFYLGLGGPIGDGSQYLPWIQVVDLCRLIIDCLEKDSYQGPVNAVAPQIITNSEFTEAFAKALKRPAILPVPTFFLNMIFSKERAIMMTEGQKVVPEKAKKIGFEYLFPTIDQACKVIIENKEEQLLKTA